MLVILRENVNNLGRIGDVVKVSDGYARNYLLPKKLVMQASEGSVAQIEHQKRTLEKKRLAAKVAAEEFAAKLNKVTLNFKRKVGKGDKMFGSVNASEIADEVIAMGLPVEKSWVLMHDALKTLGQHEVEVRVAPDVTATIKVYIAKEETAKSAE